MTIEKICVQKFLPEHITQINKINNSTGEHQTRLAAAFYSKKIWPAYSEIFVTFTEKNPQIKRTSISSMNTKTTPLDPLQPYFSNNTDIPIPKAIEKIVKERFEPITGIKFTFTDIATAKDQKNHVRISFDDDGGAWSLVGTDAINQKNGPTMNLEWFDVGTVLHEFGHVLGMVHEHQNSDGNSIKWNKPAVYEWADQTQGWDKKETNTNILNKYSNDQINGSEFDKNSAMLYFFPASLTTNHIGTSQNLRLSGEDMIWLNKIYPGGTESPATFYKKIYGIPLKDGINGSKNKKWIYISIIIASLLLLIGIGIIVWKISHKH